MRDHRSTLSAGSLDDEILAAGPAYNAATWCLLKPISHSARDGRQIGYPSVSREGKDNATCVSQVRAHCDLKGIACHLVNHLAVLRYRDGDSSPG